MMATHEGQPDARLVDLASDAAELSEAARAWFIGRRLAAVPLLIQGLADDRLGSVGHRRILLVLRELALPSTLPVIVESVQHALDRHDPIVLSGALEALAAVDTGATSPAWVSVLRSGDTDDVMHAVALLGALASERAVDLVVGVLTSDRPGIRRSAVRALATVGSAAAREALRRHRPHETDRDVLWEMDRNPS